MWPDEVDEALIQAEQQASSPYFDVLIDVPMAAGLEQSVQELDVLLGLGNAAEAQDADDAVNAARLNLAIPRGGIIDGFDTDGHDLVDVGYTNVLDTLLERFGRDGIGLHAINLGDVAARGFPVAKTVCVVCVVGILAKASKNVCPHATSGADLEDGSMYGGTDDLVVDDTALDAALEERNHSLLPIGLDVWPDGGPEGAEESFTKPRQGEERAILFVVDETTNSRRDVSKGDGHEGPRVYEVYQDIFDRGPVRHGEEGGGRLPSVATELLSVMVEMMIYGL